MAQISLDLYLIRTQLILTFITLTLIGFNQGADGLLLHSLSPLLMVANNRQAVCCAMLVNGKPYLCELPVFADLFLDF